MNPPTKRNAGEVPAKDAAKDLKTFEALPEKKKALARLQDDADKTSGEDAVKVQSKIQKEEED
jgi:hypothetical protein